MIIFSFRFFIIVLVLTSLSSPVYAISGTSSKGKINIDINNILTGLKTPNKIYLEAAKSEKKGKIKKALFLYTHLTEKYPDSDLAIKAMDRILNLEKEQKSASDQKAAEEKKKAEDADRERKVREAALTPTTSPQASSIVGKTVTFKEWFSYNVDTGSGIANLLMGGGMPEKFEVTWTAVIEQELGDQLKVIVKNGEVTDGKTSIAGAEDFRYHSRKVLNEGIGKTRVMSKSEIAFK